MTDREIDTYILTKFPGIGEADHFAMIVALKKFENTKKDIYRRYFKKEIVVEEYVRLLSNVLDEQERVCQEIVSKNSFSNVKIGKK